nr:glycosyltransferase [Acuticoccus mangrovi]
MSELPDLVRTPYFLIISTIEARKNHLLLLNIWQRLVAEFGDAAPKLIIAGKRGWEAQTTLAMLDRARALDRHVYEAGAVPDEALDVLRRNATALLMPSFVEGFGMPVTEALAVDTPVIASDIPVFREVVGDAAELIDPTDGPAWRAAILDYAAPDSPRRAAALARAQRFAAPTWQSHFARVAPFLEEVIGETRPSLSQKAREALRKVSFEPAPDRGRLMPRH